MNPESLRREPTAHSTSLPTVEGALRRRPPAPPSTPVVGRDSELSHLDELLTPPGPRIVSLLGPGGVGKTRLALTVARSLERVFAGGVVFVRLDGMTSGSLWDVLGRHLSLSPTEGVPWIDTVIGALGFAPLLLVLDNCESAPGILDDVPIVLDQCPNVVVIATSRETLRLPGEHEVWLEPLALPSADEVSPEAIAATPAVQMFVACARQVASGFNVTSANSTVVRDIVRNVDGLPLGIELAAAAMRHLTPVDILTLIHEALPALAGGSRGRPKRQQSLRAMVRWSLDMLSPELRRDTLRLAIFPRGFASDSVAPLLDSGSRRDAWALLLTLADKSLIQGPRSRNAGSDRFNLLQTVRSVLREELEGQPDLLEQTLMRQARALVKLAQEADRHYHGPEGLEWLRRMRRSHADIQAFLEESLTRPALQADAIRLCGHMFWFWYTQGYYWWAIPRIERLLDTADAHVSPDERAAAHVTAGWLAHRMAKIERAERHFEAARSHFSGVPMRASLLGDIGSAYVCSFDRRDTPGAIRLLESVIERADEVANSWHEKAAGYFGIGILRYFDAELDEARDRFTETVRLGRAHNDAQSIGMSLMYLAHVDRAEGRPGEAFWKLREALPLLMEIGDLATTALLLDIVSSTLIELEASQLALEAFTVGEHLRATMGIPRSPLEQPDADATRERIMASVRQPSDEDSGKDRTIDLGKTIDRLLRYEPEQAQADDRDDRRGSRDGGSSGTTVLSPRELEVLQLVATGMTSSEIAQALFVSPHTVKRHMANIRQKLGVRSQAAAVAALREQRSRWS